MLLLKNAIVDPKALKTAESCTTELWLAALKLKALQKHFDMPLSNRYTV